MSHISRPQAGRTTTDGGIRRACRSPLAITLFILIAIGGIAGDLLSKHYVFNWLGRSDSTLADLDQLRRHQDVENTQQAMAHLKIQRNILPGVDFTLSTNPGVVFGLSVPRWVVLAATSAAALLVIYFFATAEAKSFSAIAALAMILGGALGNLYDRLLGSVSIGGLEPLRHQVRDFIDCSGLYYPYVFNVADVLLVVGVGLLMINWLLDGRDSKRGSNDRSQTMPAGN